MKKIFFILVLFSGIVNTHAQSSSRNTPDTASLPARPSQQEIAEIKTANSKKAAGIQFQYFIIKAAADTYGYSIYADGNLYIQQTTVPAMSGSKGFADTTGAAKTARLVIEKIKQGEMPPTITVDDLKKLKVIQ